MKRFLFCLLFIALYIAANSQFTVYFNNRTYQVLRTSVFKDSADKEISYETCLGMLTGGEYDIRPINHDYAKEGFKLTPLSKEEQIRRLEQSQPPKESPAFTTGKKFPAFSVTDINGNLIATNELKGKIIVINFWFTTCPPCRMERPYLNKIADDYKDATDVVFIGIALDNKQVLDKFLANNPFSYQVIPDGRAIAAANKVNNYPTHVIINKQGKIAFHTVGFNAVTGYWMRKTIDGLRK